MFIITLSTSDIVFLALSLVLSISVISSYTGGCLACVASVSVGFQSRERRFSIIFAAREMGASEKIGEGGGGKDTENHRNTCYAG